MKYARQSTIAWVLVAVAGCTADAWRDSVRPAFTKAVVSRVNRERGGRAENVTLTGDRLDQLIRFLPGVGRGHDTGWGASGITGLEVVLYREDGHTVNVHVSMDMTTWSEGHGSHWLDPRFAEFIAEEMPPAVTSTNPVAAR